MNTIVVQLNERQLNDLQRLLDEAFDMLSLGVDDTDYTDADRADIERLCDTGISEIRNAIADRHYLWTSGCGYLTLGIPTQAVDDIARPASDNLPAVEAWLAGEETNYLRAQVERLNRNDIRCYLTECGIDGVREKTTAECRMHLLWMACWDIHEEKDQEG